MVDELVYVTQSAAEPITKVGKKWLVTIAVPGKGSNDQNFDSEVLKNTGPIAVPAGTKSFFTHAPTEKRDPRDQVGVFEDGAFWNEEEQKLQALLTPFPRYENVLEEAGRSIEASLHVQGRRDPRTGFVRELTFRRDNTVDLVAFGGLEGTGLEYQVVQSLFAAAAAEIEEENTMAFEVTEKMWGDFTASVAAGFAKVDTFIEQSMKEVKGEADQAAVDALVKAGIEQALTALSEVEDSINETDIPAAVKQTLIDSARAGEDVTDALATAVAVSQAYKAENAPDPKKAKRATVGVVPVEQSMTDDAAKPRSLRIDGWKRN